MARLENTVERRSRSRVAITALAIACDVVGLLALPCSVLALTHGRANVALASSLTAAVTIAARAVLTAKCLEGSTQARWEATVAAAARYSVLSLKRRPEHAAGVTLLIEATHASAEYDAVIAPHAIASLVALVIVAIVTASWFGVIAVVVGVVAALGVGAFVVLGQRKLGPLRAQAWTDFGELALHVRVLLEGATELRAHGREHAFANALLARARGVARAERKVSTWSGLMGFWPLAVATAMLAAPVRAGVAWARTLFAIDNAAAFGLLGATALILVWNISRAVKTSLLDAPARRVLEDFVAHAPEASRDRAHESAASVAMHAADVTFDHVSVIHPGASRATPRDVTYRWEPGQGLAISGVNGAGKSTLALVLLGLVDCTEGRITIGGVDLRNIDPASLRGQTAYVAQAGFVSPGATVGWHLGLLADEQPDLARCIAALSRVGLLDVLSGHVARGGDVLGVHAGQLSGGERQRMLLARALLQDAQLLILDEPEVGLDAAGRAWLYRLLDELSQSCRVLLIAHDDSIVPTSFAHLLLEPGAVVRDLAAE
ncbi:MAG: transporter [Myxococcaceae bacterium]|nr:transporter [Myxococcaceae bacterium]